jgi:ketosteroid isomerase-like protein
VHVATYPDIDQGRAAAERLAEERADGEQPTTPDVVELTQRAVEAAERGDWDAVMSPFAPHAVWDMSPQSLGVFEGRAAIRGFLEDWWRAYEELAVEVDEVLDLGKGIIVRVITQRGRLAGGMGEVCQRSADVFLWVDGLIERVTADLDIAEARAAAERLAKERSHADA